MHYALCTIQSSYDRQDFRLLPGGHGNNSTGLSLPEHVLCRKLPDIEDPLPPRSADALRTLRKRLRKPVIVMWHGSWFHHPFPKLVLCVKAARGGMTMSTWGLVPVVGDNYVLYDAVHSAIANAWQSLIHQ